MEFACKKLQKSLPTLQILLPSAISTLLSVKLPFLSRPQLKPLLMIHDFLIRPYLEYSSGPASLSDVNAKFCENIRHSVRGYKEHDAIGRRADTLLMLLPEKCCAWKYCDFLRWQNIAPCSQLNTFHAAKGCEIAFRIFPAKGYEQQETTAKEHLKAKMCSLASSFKQKPLIFIGRP